MNLFKHFFSIPKLRLPYVYFVHLVQIFWILSDTVLFRTPLITVMWRKTYKIKRLVSRMKFFPVVLESILKYDVILFFCVHIYFTNVLDWAFSEKVTSDKAFTCTEFVRFPFNNLYVLYMFCVFNIVMKRIKVKCNSEQTKTIYKTLKWSENYGFSYKGMVSRKPFWINHLLCSSTS